MASRLMILNTAIRHLGTQQMTPGGMAHTTGATASGVVAEVYTEALAHCLEQGRWKFALSSVELTPSLTEIPTFGYVNAFAKPANYVHLNRMCVDEYFNVPSSNFDDRGAFWYMDEDVIYVEFVSSEATARGGYLAGWPQSYADYVALYLAYLASNVLDPERTDDLEVRSERAKLNALAKDAVLGPTQFLPPGKWTRARSDRIRARSSNSSFYGS
jgi:hypothetical protein